MVNLSMQEQKQINGGDYLVKCYNWDTGKENLNLRARFSRRGDALKYIRELEHDGYDDTYNIVLRED